jgi:hypothetical protein
MRTWIRSLFPRSSRPTARAFSRTRLGVESLDERAVPAGVSPGTGHLLANVEVTAVFDGYVPQSAPLTNFLNQIVDSPYLDQLGEYSTGGQTIGRGSFSGTDVGNSATRQEYLGGSWYTTTDDADITNMLDYEIAAGRVPAPDGNRLYVVYTQPGTVVNALGGSAGQVSNGSAGGKGFGGYHTSATDYSGRTYYYAVIVDPTGYPGGPPAGRTSLQTDTITTSHEMAEAITDPVLFTGWRDSSNSEIGDLAESIHPPGGTYATLDGFTVQKLWSNRLNTSTAAPADAVRYVTGVYNGVTSAFVLTANGVVEKLDTATGNWNPVTGSITNASQLVSASGSVYIVAANQGGSAQVWKYLGSGSNWQQITGSNYIGKLESVAGQLFLDANNGANWEIFQYSGSGMYWPQLTAPSTNVTRFAADGTSLYFIANNYNGAYQVYRYDVPTANWAQLTGSSTVTDLAAGGGHVYIVASNGGPNHNQVYRYDDWGMSWSQLTNSPSVSTIALAGTQLYVLANNGGPNQVFKYNGTGMNWTQLTYASSSVESIAAAGDGLYAQFYTGPLGTGLASFADSQVRKFGGAGYWDWSNVSGGNTVSGSLSSYGDQLQVETFDPDGYFRFRQYSQTPLSWYVPPAR